MTGLAAMAAVDTDDYLATFVSGIAVGCTYALVALGFVIIFKATGVLNFAQSAFVLVGAYLTYNASQTWGMNFYLALLFAMAAGFVLAMVVHQVFLRTLVGQPPFTMIMVTIGVLYVVDNVVTAIWGPENLNLGDPWGIRTVEAGSITIAVSDLWTMGLAAAVLLAFLGFFRFSKLGLAMRATAIDQEVALAQGISARSVYLVSWGIAGAVAALAGATLASGSVALQPGVGLIALVAFPAMILGGLESPLGAVVGGLIIGLVQQFTSLLAPEYLDWVGPSFERVSPYLVMVVILLVRPYGLFGTKEVRRV